MKAQLLASLKGAPLAVYLLIGSVAAGAAWLAVHDANQRQRGADEIIRKQLTAALDTARRVSDSTAAVADSMRTASAILRVRARAEAAKDAATQARADAAIQAASSERDAARRLLEDSMATTAQLRGQVGRMIVREVADSITHAQERAQAARTKAALLATIDGDSTAIRSAAGAIAAAIKRAEAAERLAKAAKPARVGLLSRCGAIAGYGGVLAGGGFTAGPALTLGCRVFP